MTTFVNKSNNKIANKTIFTHIISSVESIKPTSQSPKQYNFVELLGITSHYGAVFKAYDTDEHDFTLFFGIAGDEFNS